MSHSNARKRTAQEVGLPVVKGLLLIALLGCAGCRPSQVSAGMEPQTEEYSAARKHFQTRLIRHVSAPQQGRPLTPPPDAQQVEYSPTLHLQAWISAPSRTEQAAATKRPAVLFLHGGFAIGDDDWQATQPYRDAGYFVMMPVLRGENGQAGDYSMFYDEVGDVVTAAEYLSRLPNVDAKHIYVAGHSVGGTLTMLATLTWPGFRAAAAFSGAPDPITWSQGQPEVIVFDPKDLREFQMRSPVAFAYSFKCPTRIYYGNAEPYFTGASQQTAARARQKGLDVEAIKVSGDHFSAVPEETRQSILFFRSH